MRGLQRDAVYSDAIILHPICCSLHGKAADVILHLGEDVHISQVLGKLDQIFGNVLPSENILEKFYIVRQEAKEDVALLRCRIEDLLAQLRKKNTIMSNASEGMLRTKFYSELKSAALKSAIRPKFDGGENFTSLLISA